MSDVLNEVDELDSASVAGHIVCRICGKKFRPSKTGRAERLHVINEYRVIWMKFRKWLERTRPPLG